MIRTRTWLAGIAATGVAAVAAALVTQHAYGMQFHVEVTAETVQTWATIPEYARALTDALGPEALPGFDSQVTAELPRFNQNARMLYDRLKEVWTKA